jgi:peptidoglycan/xylan/chitin deacetylase (PgdA/CDA1 family)
LQPLTSLTNEQIVAELGWTRKAIKAVLGVTPLTMRPPYGDIEYVLQHFSDRRIFSAVDSDRVRAIALAMGMVPVIWTRTPSAGQFDSDGAS